MNCLRRRRGIALAYVLIMSVVGMTLLGVMMSYFGMSSGSTRATVAKDAGYNYAEDAIERAKAALKKEMHTKINGTGWVLHWDDSKSTITSADDLRVRTRSGDIFYNLDPKEQEQVTINGQKCELSVRIYDMLYNVAKVPKTPADAGMTEAEYDAFLASLPPSVEINDVSGSGDDYEGDLSKGGSRSDTTGAYLIRAILEVDGKRKIIETAVLQSID